MKTRVYLVLTALLAAAATPAAAGPVLIINGTTGSAEPGNTANVTAQLTNLHTQAGNAVTISDSVPVSLGEFEQVWDLRFSNSQPITGAIQSQYLSYLQGGGGMFLMGENTQFPVRNDSIFSLIQAAGGGSLGFFIQGGSIERVYAPFTGPNPITTVQYLAQGGANGFGTGQWISSNAAGTAGAGVAFGAGTLANAPAGALATIFDVQWLRTDANAQSQSLARNLITYLDAQVNQPAGAVPEPGTWAMMIIGFGAVGMAMRRRGIRPQVAFG